MSKGETKMRKRWYKSRFGRRLAARFRRLSRRRVKHIPRGGYSL